MDPTSAASLSTVLTALGLGQHVSGIISLIVAAAGLIQAILIFLPVANAASPGWYQILYGVLSRIALNVGKNAPSPPAGTAPAGGAVPTPPALKTQ